MSVLFTVNNNFTEVRTCGSTASQILPPITIDINIFGAIESPIYCNNHPRPRLLWLRCKCSLNPITVSTETIVICRLRECKSVFIAGWDWLVVIRHLQKHDSEFTTVDKIHAMEILLDSAPLFIVLYEIITIIVNKDHLLLLKHFFMEILSFLPSISIKPETGKYRMSSIR